MRNSGSHCQGCPHQFSSFSQIIDSGLTFGIDIRHFPYLKFEIWIFKLHGTSFAHPALPPAPLPYTLYPITHYRIPSARCPLPFPLPFFALAYLLLCIWTNPSLPPTQPRVTPFQIQFSISLHLSPMFEMVPLQYSIYPIRFRVASSTTPEGVKHSQAMLAIRYDYAGLFYVTFPMHSRCKWT